MSEACFERLSVLLSAAGVRPGNFRFSATRIFEGVDLRGATVLDVGAGSGYSSFYAACAGAELVVSLEPEAAGSQAGVRHAFERGVSALGLPGVHLVPETLQAYDPRGQLFDVVLLDASINHLDEEACMRLRDDSAARATYADVFGKLVGMSRPGARLIVVDCGRRNLFPALGLRNPIARSIEWDKHQEPQLWATLLTEAGFRNLRLRWLSFNTLRRPGRLVLGNRLAAFFLTSAFCLTMERPEGGGAPDS